MYIITASFDPDVALEKASELLALADTPDRLADRLNAKRDLARIKEAVRSESYKQVINDLLRVREFVGIEKKIETVKKSQNLLSFLGNGYREKKLGKLQETRRKIGSLLEAPRWFYGRPRVQLLFAIRDYALDISQQGDAAWTEVEESTLEFPLAQMFETADLGFAATVVAQLEKPLKDTDPKFLLTRFEGNRSISFDLKTHVARYYAPAPTA